MSLDLDALYLSSNTTATPFPAVIDNAHDAADPFADVADIALYHIANFTDEIHIYDKSAHDVLRALMLHAETNYASDTALHDMLRALDAELILATYDVDEPD